MLSRGEAEVSSAPLSIIPERVKVIDFPFPIRLGKIGLTMSIATLQPWNFMAYTDILKGESWLALALVMTLIAIANKILCRQESIVKPFAEVSRQNPSSKE